MTRVFLSYTKENSGIARRVSDALKARGAEVYWFEDPEEAGGRFMRNIPREIEQADIFVALMSPAALKSPFCAIEHEIAVHRELTVGDDFVYVLEVAPIPKEGWLRVRDCIDLTPEVTDEKFERAVAALPLGTKHNAEPAAPSQFQNRTQELERILDELTTTGGMDHWLVLSPPKMGKTWFLREVSRRFAEKKKAEDRAKLVNLRDEELDVRYDPVRVLCLLLEVDPPDETLDEDARLEEIAGAVAVRGAHHLALLDNAELMDRTTTIRFRKALRHVHQLIDESPTPARLSIVVGSRRQEGWSGSGAGDRLRVQSLTGFEQPVVQQVLKDTGLPFQQPSLDRWTAGLYDLSRGLPALLVSAVTWAKGRGFINPATIANGRTFDEVVAPYIKRELLSIHSLLPDAGKKLVERHAAVVAALQALAPYRIVTASHLKHHLDQDPAFADALDKADWTRDDLWNAIADTALLLELDNDIWLSHYPPIRQLLYEHFYRSTEDQHATHVAARAFYQRWAETGAGAEQPKMLVESLWHEACLLCCTGSQDLRTRLPEVAVELTRQFFARPAVFEPVDLARGVRRQLTNDDEFAQLVSCCDGLFDDVVNRVSATIVGGE
ncbi:MAG: TIR domain-containing protein [Actinomycetota bacterium]|nr:TIR domain-containing protein [Actinomycetota bacterium]